MLLPLVYKYNTITTTTTIYYEYEYLYLYLLFDCGFQNIDNVLFVVMDPLDASVIGLCLVDENIQCVLLRIGPVSRQYSRHRHYKLVFIVFIKLLSTIILLPTCQ